jgi:tRNA A-37 threonylcarbamoyl transferase component Bud32
MDTEIPCIPTKEVAVKGWKLKSDLEIGEKSAVGKVYHVCKAKDCDYAMKIMRGKTAVKRTKQEVINQNKCAKRGYCFRVIDHWTCEDKGEDIGIIITRFLKDTLFQRLKQIPDGPESWQYIKDAILLLRNFHKSGMYHGDAHPNNFMFARDGKFVFIDVEKAGKLSKTNSQDRYYKILNDYGTFKTELEGKYLPRESSFYSKVIDSIYELFVSIKNDWVYSKNKSEKDNISSLDDIEMMNVDFFLDLSYENLMSSSQDPLLEMFKALDVPSDEVIPGDEEIVIPWRERAKEGIPSPCRPEKDRPIDMGKDCSFTGQKIYTAQEAKELEYKPYTKEPTSEPDISLFNDYLDDLPVYVLKEGTILVHATTLQNLYESKFNYDFAKGTIDPEYKIAKKCWWKHTFPGQKNYGGGWFTYKTSYGGPEYFDLFLYYKIQKDTPIFFIPDYSEYIVEGETNEYIDYPNSDVQRHKSKYSGSHVIQGPRDWKKKGYKSLRDIKENGIDGKYFADGIGYTLARLGFNGYMSCDECEVFLSHEAMKEAITYPFRMDYSNKGEEDDVLRFLIQYCMRQKSPLQVTQLQTRGKGSQDYIILKELDINLLPPLEREKEQNREQDLFPNLFSLIFGPSESEKTGHLYPFLGPPPVRDESTGILSLYPNIGQQDEIEIPTLDDKDDEDQDLFARFAALNK